MLYWYVDELHIGLPPDDLKILGVKDYWSFVM